MKLWNGKAAGISDAGLGAERQCRFDFRL